MEDIGFFTQLYNEVININIIDVFILAITFLIPFYFSKKSQSLFFQLVYAFFGIYLLATLKGETILYDSNFILGLGLLIPQIWFIIAFIVGIVMGIKMMSTNIYYFFITLYYKLIRFSNWLKSTYIMLKTFFTTFSFKKEDYKQSEQKYDDYSYKYKEQKFSDGSREKERKSENKKQNYTNSEDLKNENNSEYGKYAQFYSDSEYIVLGVSANDDYKTIKKAYRTLVREYHPDLNPDKQKQYTEITQHINNAWEKVQNQKL